MEIYSGNWFDKLAQTIDPPHSLRRRALTVVMGAASVATVAACVGDLAFTIIPEIIETNSRVAAQTQQLPLNEDQRINQARAEVIRTQVSRDVNSRRNNLKMIAELFGAEAGAALGLLTILKISAHKEDKPLLNRYATEFYPVR